MPIYTSSTSQLRPSTDDLMSHTELCDSTHRSSQIDSKNSSPLSCSSIEGTKKTNMGSGYSKVHVNVLGKIKDRTGIPV